MLLEINHHRQANALPLQGRVASTAPCQHLLLLLGRKTRAIIIELQKHAGFRVAWGPAPGAA